MGNDNTPRRRFLKYTGSGLVPVSFASLAGCTGNGGSGTTTTADQEPSPDQTTESTEPTIQKGGTLRIGLRTEPESLAPTHGVNVFSSMLILNIYDTYTWMDYENAENNPELLESWEWADETTLKGKVREGVEFHKGYGELTAEDIVYKTNNIVNDSLPELFIYSSLTEGAEQTGKYTFEWNFTQGFTPFTTSVLPSSAVGSKQAVEEMGYEEYGRNPIGTGAFVFDEWISGDRIVLKKNENYWREGLPYVDEVVVRITPDANTQLNLLQNGEIDVIDRVSYSDVESVKNAEDTKTVDIIPAWNFDYLLIGGTNNEREDLKNPKVRKAINYAVNRRAVVENAFFGKAIPDDDPFPPLQEQVMPGSIDVYPNEPDYEQAQTLLDEAGYGDGIEANLIHEPERSHRRTAQVVAESLSNVGIQVNTEQVSRSTFTSRMFNDQTHEMAVLDITLASAALDSAVYWFLHSEGVANWIGYSNEEVDNMLDEQRATTGRSERAKMLEEVTKLFLNDSPGYAYLAHHDLYRGFRSNVHHERPLAPRDSDWEWKQYWKEQ